MTNSLIHAAFDPGPYVLFSASAIAAGLIVEIWRASKPLRELAYASPRALRTALRQALCARGCFHVSRPRIAKR